MDILALMATSHEFNDSDRALVKLYVNPYGDCYLENEASRQEKLDTGKDNLLLSGHISRYYEEGFYEVPGSLIEERYVAFMHSDDFQVVNQSHSIIAANC